MACFEDNSNGMSSHWPLEQSATSGQQRGENRQRSVRTYHAGQQAIALCDFFATFAARKVRSLDCGLEMWTDLAACNHLKKC